MPRAKNSQTKIIFLDRDGVVNHKSKTSRYIRSWSEFKFIPGVINALQLLIANNYKIFIITNQAGIGHKIMTEADLQNIHKNLIAHLNKRGVEINAIYYCPHTDKDNCYCRKPKPGLILKAAEEHNINLKEAIFVGDSLTDLEAGLAAGCKTIQLKPKERLFEIIKRLV